MTTNPSNPMSNAELFHLPFIEVFKTFIKEAVRECMTEFYGTQTMTRTQAQNTPESLDAAGALAFLNLINALHEKTSIIITTNKAPTEWAATLDDEVLASALLDRLLYHCEIIKLSGQSYRMGNRKSIFKNDPS